MDTDYCTTIEGDECCSCWDAYFELNKLEQELPKDEIARMVKDSEGDVRYLIDSIHHRSNLRKKMAEKTRATVSSSSLGQSAKPRPFPVPDGLPKTQEELAEEEEALMPESSYTRLLRRMGRYPDWYTPRPDHETDWIKSSTIIQLSVFEILRRDNLNLCGLWYRLVLMLHLCRLSLFFPAFAIWTVWWCLLCAVQLLRPE